MHKAQLVLKVQWAHKALKELKVLRVRKVLLEHKAQ